MKNVCKSSDTTLVLLPAYNENRTVINSAKSANPDLYCLDWKLELENLIKSGVDKWALCMNDDYTHSRPIAGFVAAHMIYRAIYNAIPTITGISAISTYDIKAVLNEMYLTTGSIAWMSPNQLLLFAKD